jgi:hypothetical protein
VYNSVSVRSALCCSCSYRWCETLSLNCGHQRAYCSSSRWYMSTESHGGIVLTGENRRTRRRICPSAHLSITSHMDRPGREPVPCGITPETNRLSHGTAKLCFNIILPFCILKVKRKWYIVSRNSRFSFKDTRYFIMGRAETNKVLDWLTNWLTR